MGKIETDYFFRRSDELYNSFSVNQNEGSKKGSEP